MRSIFKSLKLARFGFLCALSLCFCLPHALADKPVNIKKVLFLFPEEDWSAPAYRTIYDTIKTVLAENTKNTAFLLSERIDFHFFAEESAQQNMADFLRQKYGYMNIDLVIPVTQPSLNFALRHRDSLFSDIPIVYCGAVAVANQKLAHRSDVTGTAVTLDIAGTIELACQLQPDLKRIAVVAGSGVLDKYFLSLFHDAFKDYEGKLELIDLSGLFFADLIQRVSSLPASTSILYLTLFRDGDGRIYSSANTQKLVSQAANVPLFNFIDTAMEYGSIGGRMTQIEAMARTAGEMASRILKGESTASIEPVVVSGNPTILNWRELKRWGIDEENLPSGSVIRFRESTLWSEHKEQLTGGIALLAFEAVLIVALFLNLRKTRRMKGELAASEMRYRTVADYTYDWEYWVKIDGSLEYISPSCERISGYSVQDFKKNPELFGDIIAHEDKGRWAAHNLRAEKDLKPGELQLRIRRKDGEIRWIEHVCQPVTDPQGILLGFRASNRDITERKQAELDAQRHRAELTRFSRIATLGELSAAMAHELNQPLTAILSNAQTARRFLTAGMVDPDELKEILDDIINDDKRAAGMIKRLRTLLRNKDLEFTSLDINHVIREFAKIFNREAFFKNVPLVLDLAEGLPNVRGDAIHLEQVVLNLILNGSEAMEGVDRQFRELRILTVKHDEKSVRVSVRDKGPGIDEALIDRIFEAFYTTKPQGIGMGLSICKSIIEAHGGRLWAENRPEGGATFSFTIPICELAGVRP